MQKQLRRTLWGMLIVLAAMLTVSLTVGSSWADTTGVRISVENDSSDETFVVEYAPSDNPGHDVEILQPHGFVYFSDEAAAWVATSKTYRYKINIYPQLDQGNSCATANLTLKNIWSFGPKVESCEVRVEPGASGDVCLTAETHTNNHCNLKVQIFP
jgi:hypothetical protein